MKLKRLYALLLFFAVSIAAFPQGIIVNELSNGPSGLKEYYEFLVVGPPCTTVDLRNWIFDDNNGDFAPGGVPGLGVGIAQGHVRFKNIANWAAVPVGSIIVVYNENDKNPAITQPDDSTDSNGDCVYILPGNNSFLERCDATPNNTSAAYSPCTYIASVYFVVSLRNGGDAGQTRMPNGAYFHGISFGDIAGGPDNLLINAGSGSGNYYYFNNGNYTNVANFSFGAVSGGGETPGAANNAANQQFIDSLKNDTTLINIGNDTIFCIGGSLTLDAGAGFTTYLWSTGETTQAIAVDTTGTYWVNASNISGCSSCIASDTINVTVSPLPIAATVATNITCNGLCDGAINLTITSGTSPFSYSWSNSATIEDISSLCVGTYNITVTDSVGCTTTTSDAISQPIALAASTVPTNALCNTSCDGAIALTVSGGTTSYSYNWSNSATTQNISSLCAGNYTVTVTDANSCTTTVSGSITAPTALVLSTGSTNATCGSSNGTAIVGVSGGTTSYSYLWNDFASQTTATATGLASGMYNVTVTDANSCTAIDNIFVNNDVPISSMTAASDATCSTSCDGTATVSPSGGLTPYAYIWDNGESTATATGLCAGLHTVTVTDANNCISTSDTTINVPVALTTSIIGTDVSCFFGSNGLADLTVSGGITPYSYSWSNGVTAQDISNVSNGTYIVTVTDTNNCAISDTVIINQPSVIILTTSVTDATCGLSDGIATVILSGGTSPYSYLWNNSQTDSIASGLAAGAYTVTITDANFCTAVTTAAVSNLGAGTATISSSSNPSCYGGNNGAVTVSISGSATPFSYSWSSGATDSTAAGLLAGTHNITVTDSTGCAATASVTLIDPNPITAIVTTSDAPCNSNCDGTTTVNASGGTSPYTYLWNDPNSQTDTTATGLCQGDYTVFITDANGCVASQTDTVIEPALLSLVFGSFDATCYATCDGQGLVVPSGGTVVGTYTYDWQPIGIIGNFPAVTTFCAGNYTLTITDDNGCTTDTSFTINAPNDFTVYTSATTSNCGQADGTASVDSVLGGTGGVSYQWDVTAASQTTATAFNLTNGAYCVTITDANNCDTSVCVTVSNVSGPTVSATSASTTCNGTCDGSVSASATGGLSPYNYQWSNGTSIGLCTGTYAVTVTDANNCTDTVSITVPEPQPVIATVSNDTTICAGDAAVISAAATGGSGAPYFFFWDNSLPGNGPHTVSPTINTCYTVYASDANACQSPPDTVCIALNAPLSITAVASPVVICAGDSVNLNATAIGGLTPYSYIWDNGSTDQSTTVYPSGNNPDSIIYTVTATDGCSPDVTDAVTITFYTTPNVGFILDSTYGCEPYTVTFINQTTNADSCIWDLGNGNTIIDCNSFDYTYSSAGTYYVNLTVFNSNGCEGTNAVAGEIVVNANPLANFNFSPESTTILNPFFDFFDFSSSDVVDWLWTFYNTNGSTILGNDTAQNPTFEFPEDTGTYQVNLLITNAAGCTDDITLSVIIEGEFIIFIPNAFSPNGDGKNDEFFPEGIGIDPSDYTFYIFNRWGDLIFESHQPSKGWNGIAHELGGTEVVQDGVYVWKLKVKAETTKEKNQEYVGHVTLLK